MNTIKKNPLKCAKILLVAYFVLNILGKIIYMVGFNIEYDQPINTTLYSYIILLLPNVLLAIYIFLFSEKSKSHPLLLAYYIISLLLNLFSVFSQFSTISWMIEHEGINFAMQNIINLVFVIIGTVLMVLCVVDITNKFKYIEKTSKCLFIFYIANTIKILINIISNVLTGNMRLFIKGSIIQSISTIIFYIILLVLWFFILKGEPQQEKLEDTLINLKVQLDNGTITGEEYNKRKADILNKL